MCLRNRLYGIKYKENIKRIRHTTSEPLPCGPATTYLRNLTAQSYLAERPRKEMAALPRKEH